MILILEHISTVLWDRLEGISTVLDGICYVATNRNILGWCERDHNRKWDEEANIQLEKTCGPCSARKKLKKITVVYQISTPKWDFFIYMTHRSFRGSYHGSAQKQRTCPREILWRLRWDVAKEHSLMMAMKVTWFICWLHPSLKYFCNDCIEMCIR